MCKFYFDAMIEKEINIDLIIFDLKIHFLRIYLFIFAKDRQFYFMIQSMHLLIETPVAKMCLM